jgi:hypothetical protein
MGYMIVAPDDRLRAEQRIDDCLFHGFHHCTEQAIDPFLSLTSLVRDQFGWIVINPMGCAEPDDEIAAAVTVVAAHARQSRAGPRAQALELSRVERRICRKHDHDRTLIVGLFIP